MNNPSSKIEKAVKAYRKALNDALQVYEDCMFEQVLLAEETCELAKQDGVIRDYKICYENGLATLCVYPVVPVEYINMSFVVTHEE